MLWSFCSSCNIPALWAVFYICRETHKLWCTQTPDLWSCVLMITDILGHSLGVFQSLYSVIWGWESHVEFTEQLQDMWNTKKWPIVWQCKATDTTSPGGVWKRENISKSYLRSEKHNHRVMFVGKMLFCLTRIGNGEDTWNHSKARNRGRIDDTWRPPGQKKIMRHPLGWLSSERGEL